MFWPEAATITPLALTAIGFTSFVAKITLAVVPQVVRIAVPEVRQAIRTSAKQR